MNDKRLINRNSKTRLLFTALVFLIFTSCNNSGDKTLIRNWKVHEVSDQYPSHETSFAPADWMVFLQNGEMHVTNNQTKPQLLFSTEKEIFGHTVKSRQSYMKTNDGYLVSFYRGEWGGDLYWFSNDQKQNYKISDHEVVQFINRNNSIYAIEGLTHLGVSNGSMLNIQKLNGKWIAKTYLTLPQDPEAVALDSQNNFILVTSNSLLKVGTDAKITTLIATGVWYDGRYPNSLVVFNEDVFIGMRKGVFKYNLASGKQYWLTEN